MTAFAVFQKWICSFCVLTSGDDLHVVRVHAMFDLAEMIDGHVGWDRAAQHFVGMAMNKTLSGGSLRDRDCAIAGSLKWAEPEPAGVGLFNLPPEPLDGIKPESVGRAFAPKAHVVLSAETAANNGFVAFGDGAKIGHSQ